ncbi:hypothetical protein DFH07DRAFT_87474 [Mycena maculata]|uniref:F-box domain-containing protein n=1 Tax=Mycena maculata TaxID=230809 RepID=A0AAD7K0C2_9AGAR|nr:hypothetical protein DFH07DRAFT_87474 [Mycena maculata]
MTTDSEPRRRTASTSHKLDIVSVSTPLNPMAFMHVGNPTGSALVKISPPECTCIPKPTTGSEDEPLKEMEGLPFVEDDPSGEFSERQARVRDRATINCVAVECWKALRVPQTRTKPVPQDLSLFPSMQIDIVLEVLGHLHPVDLIHVARVNKAFRSLLHAPVAVWRSSFDAHPPLPRCPPEIPGRRWAKLLFGPRQCDECGQANTSPDYWIWRRLCTSCMDRTLSNGIPEYSHSHQVNTLIAHTFRLDGSRGDAHSDVGRIWPADGTALAQEYERLKAADDPGALEAFVDERKNAVRATEERAEEAERWSDKVYYDSLGTFEAQLTRVMKSARKRLVQEGHDQRDVDAAHRLGEWPFLEHIPRLTSKRWNKARPHVLPLVGVARSERLRRERKELVDSRTSAVAEAASHVLRTAPPKTWAYVPPFYTIHSFAPLRTLIDDPSDARLTSQDARLADALVGLPAFVEAWRAEKRALLASLLPPAVDADVATPADVRRLELATSVFTCLGSWVGGMTVTAGRSLIGWEGAGAHLRCRSLARFWDHRPHYAPEGAAAARELVRLVGLDPETTTAAEMDRLCGDGREGNGEKRFLCVLCPTEGYKGVRGRRAMRWRECVQHTIKCTRIPGFVPHAAPAWALLTDAGVEDVRRREQPDPVQFDTTWVCIICTGHYEERVQLYDAIAHVRDVHGIRSPEEGLHYMHFPGAERTYTRVPVLLSQEGDVAEYRCNRCPQGKLRSLRGLGRHVTDKHDVVAPSGADWTRVERILRTTPVAHE